MVNGLGPQDMAAVVFTFLGREQNFTRDRAKLLAAVESFQARELPPTRGGGGAPLGCQFKGRGGCVIDTLRHVAEALPVTPARRKVIVFISQGQTIPALAFDEPLPLPTDAPTPGLDELEVMLRALQRANVTLYAYSPGGLQLTRGRQDVLRVFAEHTGGRAAVDTNAPWEAVPRMFAETGGYYLIGFESTRTDGRFLAVQVRTNRPDVTVRTRSGYYAPSRAMIEREVKVAEPVVAPIERALSGGLPAAALPVTVSASSRRVPGQREAEVTLVTRVDAPSLTEKDATPVDLLVVAFDSNRRERATDRPPNSGDQSSSRLPNRSVGDRFAAALAAGPL